MATDIERLEVLIEANTKSYENAMVKLQSQTSKALKASTASVAGLDARLKTLQGTVNKVAAVFGIAFGAREILSFIKSGIEAGATIFDMSKKLGVTTKAYQELTFVASQTGATQDDVMTAFRGMTKVLGEAADGSKLAQEHLAALGITFDTIKGKSPDKIFELILDRLSKIHDPLQRAALELQMFGRSGLQLGEMATVGAKGMDALIETAHRIGYVLSAETIQNAKEAGDKLQLIGDVGSAAGVALAADFKPAIDAIANLVTSPAFQKGLDDTAKQLGAIIELIVAHSNILKVLGGAAAGFVLGSPGGIPGAFGGAIAGAGITATAGLFAGGGAQSEPLDLGTVSPPSRLGHWTTADIAGIRGGTTGGADSGSGWKPASDVQAQQDAYEKLAKSIQLETTNLTASDREQFIANETAKLGIKATADQKAGIEAFAAVLYDTRKKQQDLNEATKFFADTVGNNLIDAITGATSLKSAIDNITKSLIQAVLQAELLGEGPLAGLFGTSATTSGGTGGILGSLLGLFGHAGGGTVSGRKPVLVGERGPELFIPNTSGRVASNATMNDNRSSAPTVVINNNSSATIGQPQWRPDLNALVVTAVDQHLASGKADRAMVGRYGLRPRKVIGS